MHVKLNLNQTFFTTIVLIHNSFTISQCVKAWETEIIVKKGVKVSHSLIAVGAVGVRVPLYLGHS